MRETPRTTLSTADDKASASRYLQLLALSHRPGRSYIVISAPQAQTRAGTPASSVGDGAGSEGPATVIAIPSGLQSEEMLQLVVGKLSPLWSHRQTLLVGNGLAFEMEDFRVRVGEMRQGQTLVKGTVVEVEWLAAADEDSEEESDCDTAQLVIRAFWDTLGIDGAKEIMRVPGSGNKGFDLVNQYCQLLRSRV